MVEQQEGVGAAAGAGGGDVEGVWPAATSQTSVAARIAGKVSVNRVGGGFDRPAPPHPDIRLLPDLADERRSY